MKTVSIKQVRKVLTLPLTVDCGGCVRRILEEAGKNYKSKNLPGEVLNFITQNADSFKIGRVPFTDKEHPYVWQVFTAKSGWVFGDSVRECLDKAIATKKNWANLSSDDVTALILVHDILQEEEKGA